MATEVSISVDEIVAALEKMIQSEVDKIREELLNKAIQEYSDSLSKTLAATTISLFSCVSIQRFAKEIVITVDTSKAKLKGE